MNEKDLLSIKQFSDLTGIKQSVLRHYDEIGLFQPIQRGENGYRYYSAPQTIAVNLINIMKGAGMSLSTIAEMEKERTPGSVLKLLHKQESQLNQELLRLQKAFSIIHAYSRMIYEGLMADENKIHIQRMDELPIEFGPENDFNNGYFYDSFFVFIKHMAEQKIQPLCICGGYYKDIDAFTDTPGQPTRFFTNTADGKDTKKEGNYLVGYSRGYYGHLGDLPKRLKNYAQEHDLTFAGPVYEVYLHDEISVMDPDQYLIQVSAPIKKQH